MDPPEKLVIEVKAAGAYSLLNWIRNGDNFDASPDADFPASPERFFHFFEAYVREPTSEADLGLYEVNMIGIFGEGQNTENAPDQFFVVTRYGKQMCTALWCQHCSSDDSRSYSFCPTEFNVCTCS